MGAKSPEAVARQNASSLENYHMYREAGICPRCKQAFAEPGRVYCGPCKRIIYHRRDINDPGREKRNAYNRSYKARMKAAGLCVDCGKVPPRAGHTRCEACEKKMRESRRKWRILQKMDRIAEEARKRNG